MSEPAQPEPRSVGLFPTGVIAPAKTGQSPPHVKQRLHATAVWLLMAWAVVGSGLLLPLAFGAGVAVMIAATGHAMDDTPIPFLVVVSTLVMVGGRGLRSRGRPQVL